MEEKSLKKLGLGSFCAIQGVKKYVQLNSCKIVPGQSPHHNVRKYFAAHIPTTYRMGFAMNYLSTLAHLRR